MEVEFTAFGRSHIEVIREVSSPRSALVDTEQMEISSLDHKRTSGQSSTGKRTGQHGPVIRFIDSYSLSVQCRGWSFKRLTFLRIPSLHTQEEPCLLAKTSCSFRGSLIILNRFAVKPISNMNVSGHDFREAEPTYMSFPCCSNYPLSFRNPLGISPTRNLPLQCVLMRRREKIEYVILRGEIDGSFNPVLRCVLD